MRRATSRALSVLVVKMFSLPLLLLLGWTYVTYSCGDDTWELERQKRDEARLLERRHFLADLQRSTSKTVAEFESELGPAYCGCNPEGPGRHPSAKVRFGRPDADNLCTSNDCGCLKDEALRANRESAMYDGCYTGQGKSFRVLKGWFRCDKIPEVSSCDVRKALIDRAKSSFHLRSGMESVKYKYPSGDSEWRKEHGFAPEW